LVEWKRITLSFLSVSLKLKELPFF
jgi:hypothetical protein